MSIKQRTAADLMSPQPIAIDPAASLRTAAQRMTQHGIHCLLVLGAAGSLPSVVTSKDIVLVLCDGEPELLDQLLVADAMTTPAICVQHDYTVADCIRLMRMAGVRSVPVLQDLTVVGVLSFTDVLKAAANE
jgi:CBS domain-containing protein